MADTPTDGAGPGRRYRGASAPERAAARRRRLLDAGLEVFGTTGFPDSTVEGLCGVAGVSPRHFYAQFADREALLAAVYDEQVAGLRAAVLAAVAAPTPPPERLRAGLAAFVAGVTTDQRVGRVVHLEVVGVSRALERHRRATLRGFATLLDEQARRLVAEGLAPDRDYSLAALALVSAVTGLVADWLVGEPRPPVAGVVDTLARLFTAALRG